MRSIVLTTTLMVIFICITSFNDGNEPKNTIKLTFIDHLQAGAENALRSYNVEQLPAEDVPYN